MQKIAENHRKGQKEIIQERLIEALLTYPTIKAAAESIGITDRTACNYLNEATFQVAYAKAREARTEEIRNSLVSLASKAREGLYELMNDPECPPATRVRAYQLALDRGVPVPAPVTQPGQDGEKTDGLFPARLLPFMTNEELEKLEQLVALLEQRKAEATKQ